MTLATPLPRSQAQIELRYPRSLRPYAGNARTHSPKQVRQIAECIRRFGFVNPILVDAEGQVIAGHGRLEAAKQLGMIEAPVLPITHLSAAEKRAYILADNRLAEKAGWDKEILAIELRALVDFDFEVELMRSATARSAGMLSSICSVGRVARSLQPTRPDGRRV